MSTKKEWQECLLSILEPLKAKFSADSARIVLDGGGTTYPQRVIELEAFARPLWGLVPFWYGGGHEPFFEKQYLEGLIAARAAFTRNYVPQADRYFLTTPEGYSAILRALMPDAANYAALFDPSSGRLMNVAGFQIIEVPHFINDGVDSKHTLKAQLTTAVLQGIVFHRSAVGTVKLRDLAMEQARRAEYQADQIIAKYAMGHGGLRPEAVGVFVKTAQVGSDS